MANSGSSDDSWTDNLRHVQKEKEMREPNLDESKFINPRKGYRPSDKADKEETEPVEKKKGKWKLPNVGQILFGEHDEGDEEEQIRYIISLSKALRGKVGWGLAQWGVARRGIVQFSGVGSGKVRVISFALQLGLVRFGVARSSDAETGDAERGQAKCSQVWPGKGLTNAKEML